MANGNLTPYRRNQPQGRGLSGSPLGGFTGRSLFDLHRQMNSLFDDLFGREGPGGQVFGGQGGQGQQGFAAPALEVHQTDDKVEITAELPGVKEDDIDLVIEDGVLTLRGEKRSTRTDEERGYSERSYGRFERSITLPANVEEEKCSAEFRDGVLTVSLPKSAERQRGRRIPLGGDKQQRLEGQNDTEGTPRQQAAQQPRGGDTGQSPGQQR